MKVNFDEETQKWFNKQQCNGITTQTTVELCDKCGLFYKPSLGHKCKTKEYNNETN